MCESNSIFIEINSDSDQLEPTDQDRKLEDLNAKKSIEVSLDRQETKSTDQFNFG